MRDARRFVFSLLWVCAGCDCAGYRTHGPGDGDVDADTDSDVDSDGDGGGTESSVETETEVEPCDGIVKGCAGADGQPVCCLRADSQTCEDLCRNTRVTNPPAEGFDAVDQCECFGTEGDLEARYLACIVDCLGPDGLQDGIQSENSDGWDLSTQFCVYEENCHCEKHYGDCGLDCPLCGVKE